MGTNNGIRVEFDRGSIRTAPKCFVCGKPLTAYFPGAIYPKSNRREDATRVKEMLEGASVEMRFTSRGAESHFVAFYVCPGHVENLLLLMELVTDNGDIITAEIVRKASEIRRRR